MAHFICNRKQFVRLYEHPFDERLTHGVTSPVWDWVFGTLPRTPIRSFEHKAR